VSPAPSAARRLRSALGGCRSSSRRRSGRCITPRRGGVELPGGAHAARPRVCWQRPASRRTTRSALLPLLRGTLDNIEQLGVPARLTGPIARGDADTVRLHLARLSPEDRVLYCGLGLELLRLGAGRVWTAACRGDRIAPHPG
jgi:hypothetical protein